MIYIKEAKQYIINVKLWKKREKLI